MSLGTLDRTPPPIFRQGPSALTKLVLCAAAAVFLMAADTRYTLVRPLRATIATTLLPIEQALKVPVRFAQESAVAADGLANARQAELAARQRLATLSERAGRADQLAAENDRLRGLLALQPALQVHSIAAEVLYAAADPYSRKIFVDRGATQGVRLGAPVVNEDGVVGQVTEVYPLSSLVTLLSDKDSALPVLNARSGQRAVAHGTPDAAALELRFVAPTAAVQDGDLLVTSGLDGVYPAGLAVGKVTRAERRADTPFMRVVVRPAATLDAVRYALVLEPVGLQLPPRPDAASAPAGGPTAPARAAAHRASATAAAAPATRASGRVDVVAPAPADAPVPPSQGASR